MNIKQQQHIAVVYYDNKVFNFRRISLIILAGRVHSSSAFLLRQSRLFIWSDKTAPAAGNPSGSSTSNG